MARQTLFTRLNSNAARYSGGGVINNSQSIFIFKQEPLVKTNNVI